jgi:hypothetical protein
MNASTANPFDDAILSDAWNAPKADVTEVHRDISDLCGALIAAAESQGRPHSLLVHGSAGSGKTHVLARLRASLAARDRRPVFCYVRLATTPNMIRRHLRQCLVNDLVRRDEDGVSQLDHILISCLDKQSGKAGVTPRVSLPARLERLKAEPREWDAARESFQEIAQRLRIDFNLARACGFWLSRQRRAEVVEWLTTGDLPEDLRSAMRLTQRSDDDADDSPEQIAGEFVNSLIRLVTDTRPLVLCFDQMEALQATPGDYRGFHALGSLVTDLFDHGLPTVFVTCAQSMLLPAIKASIPRPFFDRLAQYEKVLAGLTEDQARALVRRRVDAWASSGHALEWSLPEEMFDRFMAEGDRTPRRLFGLCRDALPRGPHATLPPTTRLLEEFETRREAALGTVRDSHGTFVHGLAQVAAAKGRFRTDTPGDRRDVDIVLSLPHKSLSIGVCNQKGNALTARLRRIRGETRQAGEERVVVRDADRPIPQTSARAREHWDAICRGGSEGRGATVRPLLVSPEALAALEAIRSIVSDSLAGDLSHDGETVLPRTVEAWIRNHLLDESVEQLLAELEFGAGEATVGEPASPALRDAVLEVVQSRRIVAMDDLARAVGCDEPALAGVVTADHVVFGVLGSPPRVVFERVSKPARESSDGD